jgi:hypothetical protein
MSNSLSESLALRIGLAARVLPGVSAARMVAALISLLRYPLTDQKLKRVSIGRLRSALGDQQRTISYRAMADAVAFLQDRAGLDVIDTTIPPVSVYTEGDMPNSLRVAVVSSHGVSVDAGFTDGLRFLIYQVSASEVRLIDVRGAMGSKGKRDPIAWRVRLIGDCHLVVLKSVNTPAAAALSKAGIHLLKTDVSQQAADCLNEVRTVLADAPPPWMGKVMGLPELERWHFPRPFAVQ